MAERDRETADVIPALRAEEQAALPADKWSTYRRIGGMVRDLAEPPPPPPEAWQERVLAAMAAQRRAIARRRRLRVVAAGLAAVAAIVLVYLLIPQPQPRLEPSLVAEITPSGESHLGQSGNGVAYRHDKLILRATASQPAEIRLYDERGLLIGRCGDGAAPGCTAGGSTDDRTYRLEVTLQRLGLTRAVLIVGDHIPSSAGNMGDDLEAARNLRIESLSPIKVL
jgi:hypothetical protein